MKILQLCNKPPVPPSDGGTIAMNNLTKGLFHTEAEVHTMGLATPKHPYHPTTISQEYKTNHQPSFVFHNTLATLMGALKGVFVKDSYHLTRFYSPELESQIIKKMKDWQPDVILFESLFMQPYFEAVNAQSAALKVYRAHNTEYTLWKKRQNDEKNPFKKWVLKQLIPKLERAEKQFVNQVDAVVPISTLDSKTIQDWTENQQIHLTPFGYDFTELPQRVPAKRDTSLIFIGALDWQPNIDGLIWFSENCWPEIYNNHPDWVFKIAGRNAYDQVNKIRGEGIEYLGEVESAWEYYSKGGIMIVPLFTGSGMRVKIIEAMAAHVPIISTTQGLEGITCTPGKHIELADNKPQFVEAIKRLIRQKDIRENMAKEAYEMVSAHYDCYQQGTELSLFLQSLLKP